jgi:hypothetical protein
MLIDGSKNSDPQRCLTQWSAVIVINGWIRQAISSSSIYRPKIFLASTAPAPAVILKMFMRVCTFGLFMEKGSVVRFFAFKGIRASAIAAEQKLVSETEALIFL